MNSHSSRYSHEESLSLLDEKTLSDVDSDIEKAEVEFLFPRRPFVDSIAKHWDTFNYPSCLSFLRRAGIAIIPSFIQPLLSSEQSRPDRLSSTAYLDGMRGLAALFVFFCHYTYTSFNITSGYGLGEKGENTSPLQLPIIRLVYSGPPMVCLFFVISGYALSLKPIKQMRSQAWENLFTTLTSSVFRRGMRLFIPTVISTFMVFVMLRFGWYESTREFASNPKYLHNVLEYHPERLPTLAAQLQDWSYKVLDFIHVWGWEPFGGSTGYDVHLWTIPVEFRCSMVLFLVLIGLARLRTWLRFAFLAMIMLFTVRWNRWEMVLFFSGMFIAELDVLQADKKTSQLLLSPAGSVSRPSKWIQVAWIVLGIVALYLMSQPDQNFDETPGWIWLSSIIPSWFIERYRFWQCVGSIVFVLAATRLPLIQRPFNHSIIQYFGKISYALYLMHGPVLHTVGYRIERWAWNITGTDDQWQYIRGFMLHSIFIIPIVLWASDIFWRAIDAPSVRFARWFEQRCCNPKEDE